jgi:hypothetical protein
MLLHRQPKTVNVRIPNVCTARVKVIGILVYKAEAEDRQPQQIFFVLLLVYNSKARHVSASVQKAVIGQN